MKKDATAPPNVSKHQTSSYEANYPRDLFNKAVVVGRVTIGFVAKETEDTVIVFGESQGIRYDIPKSNVVSSGGTITLRDASSLESYKQDKDAPLPADEKRLRATAEEIRKAAADQEKAEKINERENTRADAVLQEQRELEAAPRDATTTVAIPAGYVEKPESEIALQLKRSARELKELLSAGVKVAHKKAKEKKHQADDKLARSDNEKIASMGNLAIRFNKVYDQMLGEIRTKPYSEQENIYAGLITLLDYQRQLAVARKDMAARIAPAEMSSARHGNRRLQNHSKKSETRNHALAD
jgi:hypothetical protein